jgi:hypothetical protein
MRFSLALPLTGTIPASEFAASRMIRTICWSIVGVLMSCGTANAGTYIIDNFSNLDTPNAGGGTPAAGDHGGAVTAEVTSSTGVGVTASGGTGVYSFNAATGQILTIAYDWSGVYEDLPGHTDIGQEQAIGGFFGDGVSSIIPVDVLTGSLSDWDLLIDAPGASSVVYDPAVQHVVPAQLLIGATSLEFRFTYGGANTSLLQFGGQDLLAANGNLPEPTSLVIFGIAVCGVIARRRRQR